MIRKDYYRQAQNACHFHGQKNAHHLLYYMSIRYEKVPIYADKEI